MTEIKHRLNAVAIDIRQQDACHASISGTSDDFVDVFGEFRSVDMAVCVGHCRMDGG